MKFIIESLQGISPGQSTAASVSLRRGKIIKAQILTYSQKEVTMKIEDTVRREQFCQIKSEIRGSDQHLVVGIEVAKDRHHAFMGTATGNSLLRNLVFENNLEGFRKLQERPLNF